MESTVSNGFLLLGVGMITVFLILALVVATGSILIKITNSLYKEPVKSNPDVISGKHIAVLTAAVSHVTGGQGSIDMIEKQ